jgi:hypothetical protein
MTATTFVPPAIACRYAASPEAEVFRPRAIGLS